MYLISTELFLVANVDGLYEMEDRCLEALGDKTPFGVEAGYDGECYGINIRWLSDWSEPIYDLWFYVFYWEIFFWKITKLKK